MRISFLTRAYYNNMCGYFLEHFGGVDAVDFGVVSRGPVVEGVHRQGPPVPLLQPLQVGASGLFADYSSSVMNCL